MDDSNRSVSTTRGTNIGEANGEEQSAPSLTDKTTSTEAASGLSPDDAELVQLVAEHHKGRSHSIEITTVKGEEKEKSKSSGIYKVLTSPLVGWMTLVLISYITYPGSLAVHHSQQLEDVTVGHVWYYGWITALSTGLGVLPLIFVPHLDKFWIGVSNGMQLLLFIISVV
jgi:Fe2+ transport system protein B